MRREIPRRSQRRFGASGFARAAGLVILVHLIVGGALPSTVLAASLPITDEFRGVPELATDATAKSPASTISRGGLVFRVNNVGLATGYVESTITTGAESTVMATVNADVRQIEKSYARKFAKQPAIWVFASVKSFVAGLGSIFKLRNASSYARVAGLYLPVSRAVVLNHANASDDPTSVATVRHELTHAMIGEIIGTRGTQTIPAWLNEGSARLEEFTITGLEWFELSETYAAVSMALNSRLWTLEQMRSQKNWNSRGGSSGSLQYAVAAQAVRFLRADHGQDKVKLLMQQLASGTSFVSAFKTVTGTSLAAFEADFKRRILAMPASYPGVATASGTPFGSGLYLVIYGLRPNTAVRYTISHAALGTGTYSGRTDALGLFETFLDADWPSGTYRITATGSGGSASTSARLSSSSVAPLTVVTLGTLSPRTIDKNRVRPR